MLNPSFLRAWAEISLDHLSHNYLQAKKLAGGCPVMAVIKADAYGCGAVEAGKSLAAEGCPYFAVATIDEAVQLRKGGIAQPILILGYTNPMQAAELLRWDLTQTVFSEDYARTLAKALDGSTKPLRIHVKVDSGMGRIGFKYADEIIKACKKGCFDCEGVFTHFAVADEDADAYTKKQFDFFCSVIREAEQKGLSFSIRHCCNSAALIRYPEMGLDMVRGGIMLYGQYPSPLCKKGADLKTVMVFKSRVAHLKTVQQGESVSYGRKYVAPGERVIATIPVGYADGYLRLLGRKGAYVLINGEKAPVTGTVCMDQMMVDVTGISDIKLGQEVILFGEEPALEEIARLADTISYELLCNVGRRVPRLYYRNGKLIQSLNYINPEQ